MESWLKSSIKDRESALILGRYGVHGASSSCCTDINIHIDLRQVSQGISVNSSRKSSHLYCILWNYGIAMEPMKGQWASSRVDFGYTVLFCIPEVHQCSSRFVTVFLGTL